MRFLELNEIWEWCARNDVPLQLDNREPATEARLRHIARAQYAAGKRSHREASIATVFAQGLGDWDQALLWVTLFGVWPSSEDWPAFYALRAEHGERRSLEVAPGHVFERGESPALTAFLISVLQNAWDAYVLPVSAGGTVERRLRISHDDWLELQSAKPVEFVAPAV